MTVQAATTVGVMKTQALCFRAIGTNRDSAYSIRSLRREHVCDSCTLSKEHKGMLAHCKELLEYQNGMVAIHPRHNKLITALRTAVENGEGSLDEEATSHDNCFDAFRMSLISGIRKMKMKRKQKQLCQGASTNFAHTASVLTSIGFGPGLIMDNAHSCGEIIDAGPSPKDGFSTFPSGN